MADKKTKDLEVAEFLKKFQTLEKLLKKSAEVDDGTQFRDALRKSSYINRFVYKNISLIEDLYSLRNVFSHKNRGNYVAKINNMAIKELDKIIMEMASPPTAISKFGCSVSQAIKLDEISKVMKTMHEKTYTHIPVWKQKDGDEYEGFIGVFSYSSFFDWLAERQNNEQVPTFTKKFMADINPKYLNSPTANFDFVAEKMSVYEISPIFEKYTNESKRLDCLLITKNGKRGEKITGIVTSWDLGGI